ncbi:ABC transporter permease, partial [Streptomyces sp. T-3]|nr:ABC transporter permease [Streptomyces sp. T-3]
DGMPGLRSAVPAARSELSLSGGRQASVLALDSALAGPELRMRGDLSDGDPAGLVSALRPEKAARSGVLLPKDTARLALDLTLKAADDGPYGNADANITVTVEDRYGVPYRLQLDTLPADGKTHTLSMDLAKAAEAPAGKPAVPLSVTGIEFDEVGTPDKIAPKRLTLGALRSTGADGTARTVSVPEDLAWQAKATVDPEPYKEGGEAGPKISAARSSAKAPLDLKYHTGKAWFDPEGWGVERRVTIRVTAKRPAPALPAAVATDRFLASAGAKPGSVIEVPMPGGPIKVKIKGALRGLPTTGPSARTLAPATAAPTTDGGALLLDLRAVNQVLAARPDSALPPTEWWLFTQPGKAAQVAAALRDRAEIDPSQIQARDEIAEELHDDPLGAGPQSALLAVTVVAAALAAVGFAVSTVAAVRERSREFAVLRALGTPRRQLARVLTAEQALLIGLALIIGTVLGAFLTRAVVPLIVLTGQATQPVPGVLVELPVGRVALLLAGVAAAPVLIVAALALRRGEMATALRTQTGE